MCCYDPTCAIRSLADDAACKYADNHGDQLFKKAVDGTELAAVTKWFYGTLPEPVQTPPRLDRTKQFDVDQLLLLEAVGAHAQLFIAVPGCCRLCIGRICKARRGHGTRASPKPES